MPDRIDAKPTPQTRSNLLANEKIGRLLVQLSLPAITSMVVHALYNMVDTIFVGQWVGTLAIGAMAVAFPIQMLVFASSQTIGVGGASIISRRMGAGEIGSAAKTLGTMLFMAICLGVGVMVAGLVAMVPLLKLFGTTEAMLPYATDYFQVFLFSCPFLTVNMACNNAIMAEGNPKIPMLTMVSGAVLNIILDPLFIYVWDMGVRGAAVASAIAMILSGFFSMGYLVRGHSEVPFGLSNIRFNFPIAREILAIGASVFAREGAMSVTVGLLNNAVRIHGGEIAIATFGVVFRVFAFIFMPLMGMAQGLQPIVGFNYGAGQFVRVKQSIKLAGIAATAVATLGFLVISLFPEAIMGVFSKDAELVKTGRIALRYGVICLPLAGLQVIGGGVFQALGKPLHAVMLSLSRQVLVLIPLVLIMPRLFGLNGVWLSFPISDALSFIITLVFLVAAVKSLPATGDSAH